MTHKYLRSFKVYALMIVFVMGWWGIAFKKTPHSLPSSIQQASSPTSSRPLLDTAITAINRELLHQALSGDFQLMARLIADWDIDAQILSMKGFEGVNRLPHTEFLRSQSLSRILQNKEATEKSSSLLRMAHQFVADDTGRHIDVQRLYHKFLPQTYAAASFLLSLVPPSQIVALPRSLRKQTQLYPEAITNQIPLDIDRYHGEKLFQAGPEIAFIAHYSHPATIQTLGNQGILLYTMKDLMTLPDISQELVRIGSITNTPLQAELLKIFMEAAIVATDNQQAIFIKHFEQTFQQIPKVLVVNYHQNFSVPTCKTLTGQLLTRMQSIDISLQYASEKTQANEWMALIDKERLLKLDPDFLIITTDNAQALEREFYQDEALQKLSAARHHRLIFVDEAIQHSPSQYIVLAYHDLIQALMNFL